MSDTAAALPQASTAGEARIQRQIRPLGEQVIIRVLQPESVGSIIIPDSAKGSTHQGEGGSLVHFVEAEVVAVGPGKRGNGNPTLMDEIVKALQETRHLMYSGEGDGAMRVDCSAKVSRLILQYEYRYAPIPLQVKPGDRILYHPAVQRFDRKIDPALIGLPDTEECYIVSEMTSVLAVLERE
jgi:co-chaperonin GroES (HSP10)